MVYYLNVNIDGLKICESLGDGYSIRLKWATAYPTTKTNKIGYNIYMSSGIAPAFPSHFFKMPPSFVSFDGSKKVDIVDLIPGHLYHFAVRGFEYDPNIFNPSLLPQAFNGLGILPQSLLASDISATDTIIPLVSAESFIAPGTVKIGAELIYYSAVDLDNNTLIVPGGTSSDAMIIDQGGGNYYTANPSNVGTGTIDNLQLVDSNAPTETWTIKCVEVLRGIDGYVIPNTARFITIGSVSGVLIGGYDYVWIDDGIVVSNTILSFSITELTPFKEGDYFVIKVAGFSPLIGNGRGYNNTVATIHNVDGYDGYTYWDPNAIYWPIENEEQNTRVFECWNRFDIDHYPFTIVDGYRQKTSDILTTNLEYSDAVNTGFPAYDFAGYHRTDPVMLLSGTCIGSYIGGYMFCVDGYNGVGQQLRGLPIQTLNMQRQEVLLSTTGEPVCLIQRRWTGITCDCMLPYNEYPEARCNKCFPSGTLVRTEIGLRPIEQINVGDKVLSSDGYYHSVTEVFKNPYDGILKSINSSTMTRPILSTPEHPFYTLRGSHNVKRGCGPKCDQHTNKTYIAELHRLEWDSAENIKEKDWLATKWNKNIIDIDKISIPQKFLKNTKLGSQRNGLTEFSLDNEFLWVAGMYIAEGSAGTRSIHFGLHLDEIEYQNRIISFFKKYGYNSRVDKISNNGVCVTINSTSLSLWFPELFGKLCYNKHIPEQFMSLPNNKAISIINGIYAGDGSKRDYEITQTSEILALQIAEILHRCNKQPLIRQQNSKILTPKGNKRKTAYCVSWGPENINRRNRSGRWVVDNNILTKVKKIEDVYYRGDVYNLEVEGDHTYVVQNILVHNCFGGGIVVSYQQFFDPRRSDGRIMVRFDPVVDDLVATDSGLESTMQPNCWCLPVVSLRDRDVIVRFDEDGNEEFRYEILNVTRNKLLLNQTGVQKFTLQRIRKTDVLYMVPCFRDTSMFPSTIYTSVSSSLGIPPHSHAIQINEKIVSVSQINQLTSVAAGHNHAVQNGVVLNAAGHSHTIILP
jgi:intein/homing endonuclease